MGEAFCNGYSFYNKIGEGADSIVINVSGRDVEFGGFLEAQSFGNFCYGAIEKTAFFSFADIGTMGVTFFKTFRCALALLELGGCDRCTGRGHDPRYRRKRSEQHPTGATATGMCIMAVASGDDGCAEQRDVCAGMQGEVQPVFDGVDLDAVFFHKYSITAPE